MRKFSIALVILLCCAAPARAAAPERPEKLPETLQAAIDAKDSASVMAHLDLERIISAIFAETLPQINARVQEGEIILNPPLAAALSSLNSGSTVMKRTAVIFLTAEIGKLLVYAVDSGSFAGRPLPEDERQLLDGGVFSKFGDVSLDRKEFSGAALLRENEKTALIQTNLYDYGVRRSYPLKLRLELENGLWQATGIENSAELCEELLERR